LCSDFFHLRRLFSSLRPLNITVMIPIAIITAEAFDTLIVTPTGIMGRGITGQDIAGRGITGQGITGRGITGTVIPNSGKEKKNRARDTSNKARRIPSHSR
jgi:hypothetical protein